LGEEELKRQMHDLLEIIHLTERVSAKIHGALDEAEVYRTLREEFVKSKPYNVSIFLLTDDGSNLRLVETSLSPEKVKAGEKAAGLQFKGLKIDLNKSTILSQVVREGKTIEAGFIDILGELVPIPLAHSISKIIGYEKQSGILTPLKRYGSIVGMLAVDSTELAEYLTPSVKSLAQHISTALELAEEHTERKKVEDQLKRQVELMEKTFNSMTDAVFVLDAQRHPIILGCNTAASTIFGYKKAEMLGRNTDFLHMSDRTVKEFKSMLYPLADEGRLPFHLSEFKMKRKDGSVFPSEHIVNQLLNDEGERIGWVSIVRDITERKRVKEELMESEEKYRTLMEEAPIGICNVDITGKVTYVNKRFEDVSGYSREEVLGKNGFRLGMFPHETLKIFAERIKDRLRGKPPRRLETQFKCKDGRWIWAEIEAKIIKRQGIPVGFQLASREITERKKAEEELRSSEEKLRSILASSPDAITVTDLEGRIVECNQATLDMHGYSSKDEVIGKKAFEFIAKKDRGRAMENLKKTLEKGSVKDIEYTFLTKDGREFPAELSASVIKDSSGNPVAFMAITEDITLRKRGQKALIDSEERYRSLVQTIPECVYSALPSGDILYMSPATETVFGYSAEEFQKDKDLWIRLIHEDDRKELLAKLEKLLKKGVPYLHEFRMNRKDGKIIWIRDHAEAILDEKGKPAKITGITYDVTDRKKAEEEIWKSQDRYRELADSIGDVFFAMDKDLKYTYWNKASEKLTGIKTEDAIGKSIFEIFPDTEDTRRAVAVYRKVLKTWQSQTFVNEYDLGGRNYVFEISAYPSKEGVSVFVKDVTESKRITEELKKSEEKFEKLFMSNPESVVYLDMDDRILDVNPRFKEVFGFSLAEIKGKHINDVMVPKDRIKEARMLDKKARQGYVHFETVRRRKDGALIPVAISTAPVTVKNRVEATIVVYKDITERKRMEEELRKHSQELEDLVEVRTKKLKEAERMAAIGETTTMIGHDLRNPLQSIVNTVYLLREKLKPMPSPAVERQGLEKLLGSIDKQVEYMNKLVSDLQDYARPLKPELRKIGLRQMINDALSAIRVPENVRVSTVFDTVSLVTEKEFVLKVDPLLMRRVFTNLIMNALQSMPDGGRLTIIASKTEEAVSISIEDTGVGIPKEVMSKLFQPLFTIKPRGAGLGLPVCKRMVEAHGGTITLKSKVGRGTIVTVKIPL